jgi:hypothetical protein
MMAIADIAFSPLRHLVSERRALQAQTCHLDQSLRGFFLLNHKAALEPSDPASVALTQTHATRMVPGAHNAHSSPQDATVGVGVRLHGNVQTHIVSGLTVEVPN